MKKVDETLKMKVVNWMREEQNGVIQIRTAKEAKEKFNLGVTERAINGWVSKRGVTSKEIFKEAKEIKKKEVVERFISLGKVRETFNNRAIKMLMDITKLETVTNQYGEPLIDGEGGLIKTPSIPGLKAMQSINIFKEAIDSFTGFSDLEKLEKMDQQISESIRDFKHKKKVEDKRLELLNPIVKDEDDVILG